MNLTINTDKKTLTQETDGKRLTLPLYSKEAFELISHQWLRAGWQQKYSYTFTWLGRPILQLPEDMVRMQEVIYTIRPDVIVETGVAHGGSLIYYAALCKLTGRGRVIGVDIEIKPRNRKEIEDHELASYITLIEGNSVDPEVVNRVKKLIKPSDRVLVVLDSCHTKKHVMAELVAYSSLVSKGSYLVAADGVMKDLCDLPSGRPEWASDNPLAAISEFTKKYLAFKIERPRWIFNESGLDNNITYWPSAWLKRII